MRGNHFKSQYSENSESDTMRVVQIIIFLTFAILLHYAESASTGNYLPEPAHGVLPARFYYDDGTIHELNRPNARAFVVDGYFLGMEEGRYLHPIFNDNPFRVYSFRQHGFIVINTDDRSRLLEGRPLGRRRQEELHQAPVRTWSGESDDFSGLPARYFYANGTVHEYGRLNTRPVIVQNYFLGMIDRSHNLHPVDSNNPFHVYSLLARTMVMISPQIRQELLNQL